MFDLSRSVGRCIITIVVASGVSNTKAATATAPRKTPAQCNQELYSRMSELRSAGELPSRFIHDCWGGTLVGANTPVTHGENAAAMVIPKPEPSPAILVRKASGSAPHSSGKGTRIARERFGKHGPARYVMHGPARHHVAFYLRRPKHNQGYVEVAARKPGYPPRPLFPAADLTVIQAAPELVYVAAALAPQTHKGRQWARSLLVGAAQKRSSEVAAALIDLSIGSSDASDAGTRRWVRETICDQPVLSSSNLSSPICFR